MGKAVYHIQKGKDSAGGLGHHIDRTPGKEHTYEHVDHSLIHLNKNYNLNKYCSIPLPQAINQRIAEGHNQKRAIRDNAVRYNSHIMSSDEDTMKKIFKDGKGEEWVKSNIAFLEKEFGKENIIRVSLHLDEKTPHLHAITIPLTSDGRLNAKEIMGDKNKMRERQTTYAEMMKDFGIERGIDGTAAKHETIQEYRARIKNVEPALSVKVQPIKEALGVTFIKSKDFEEIQSANKTLHVKIAELQHENKIYEQIEKQQKEKIKQIDIKINQLNAKIKQYQNERDKVLIDKDYRNQIFQERFKASEQNIKNEIIKIAKQRDVKIEDIDNLIRKNMPKVNSKINVWEVLDRNTQDRGQWEKSINNFAQEVRAERHKYMNNFEKSQEIREKNPNHKEHGRNL